MMFTRALALLTGVLLYLSDYPVHWWWLQFVAFVPFWWALLARRSRAESLWPIGVIAALGNGAPLLWSAGLAAPIVVAVAASVVQWALIAIFAGRLIGRSPVLGPLAAGAAFTLAEVTIWYAVPLFGTAQCCVRPLSAAPFAVGFIAFTGIGGLVFVVVTVQALFVVDVRGGHRTPFAVALAIVVCAGVLDVVRWRRELGPSLRVATVGWHGEVSDPDADTFFDNVFDIVSRAGARLLVTPETGVSIGASGFAWPDRATALAFLGARCARHDLTLALGVWCSDTRDNRILFVDASGALAAEYRKTHLIPWLESYNAGDGTRASLPVGEILAGGMICQDDNFSDVARGYGASGVAVLAVPTNDWPAIAEYHLENGIFRAIENGFAIVRATSNGVSAVISPRGEVVMRHDHVTGGERVLIVDVATGDGSRTIYARFGDWPIAVLCLGLVLAAFGFSRSRPES